MTTIERAVTWAEEKAANEENGYSRINRQGPDYDCSSLVINAWEQAGVPVKEKGATYTGNMRLAFLACGFKDITGLCNLATGAGIQRGDVLLNYAEHTAICTGTGRIVHARSDDGHPETGDQTGREICIDRYYKFADCVLRYDEAAAAVQQQNASGTFGGIFDKLFGGKKEETPASVSEPATTGNSTEPKYGKTGLEVDGICGTETWMALANRMPYPGPWLGVAERMPLIRKGNKGPAVTVLQVMLNQLGADLEPDGDFGKLTENRLIEFQEGSV